MIHPKLGRYVLKRWLGGGRFGDVYLATDTLLNRDFAVKVIRVTPSNLEALLDEARVLSTLEHPNIVRFYTVDMVDDRLIIVMEYVEGTSLRKIIDQQAPVSVERAVFYIEQLLSALHEAHKKGVIHRDVKPENVLVTSQGRVKLLDFGLARLFEKDLSMSMGGTPLYMAPETWKGEFSERSDIWSCGVILYELLTGMHPFKSLSFEELRGRINRGIGEDAFPDTVPERIREAIVKATSVEPDARFSSCKEFMESIRDRRKPLIVPMKSGQHEIDILNKLTEEQRAAIEEDNFNVLLIGGPGTGKTFTLVAKALYLVKEKGVSPSQILITTFNIRGYKEIEARIEKYLGTDTQQIWLGNFHQLAIRVLSRFGRLSGLPEDFTVVPPTARKNLAEKIAQRLTAHIGGSISVVDDILQRFHRARAHLLDKEEFLEQSSGRWRELLSEFWDVYNETIIKEKALDYEDLIYFTCLLFKRFPETVEFYRERINYILVDEAQDLSRSQIYIIETLGKGKRLFITGDDDQSIYQWRGALPEYLQVLRDRKGFKVFKLTRSFRLPKQIRDVAFNLIQHNRARIPKLFWTSREAKEFFIDVKALNTPQDEAEFVCDIIDILKLKEGYSYSDFCILYRTNARGRLIESTLKKRKIPYSFQFGKSLYMREEVQLAIDLLKYAVNPGPRLLSRIRNRATLLGLSPQAAKESDWFNEFIERIKDQSTPSSIIFDLIKLLGRSVEFSENKPGGLIRLNSLEELLRQAKDFEERSRTGTVSAFLSYLRFLIDSGVAEEDEGVRLLSVHSAKGLEFPVVFLVGMVEGEFPLSRALGVEEELEEERRLCYTAITRATEKLFVTYYRFSSRYTRFEEKPSRFIKEMLGL